MPGLSGEIELTFTATRGFVVDSLWSGGGISGICGSATEAPYSSDRALCSQLTLLVVNPVTHLSQE